MDAGFAAAVAQNARGGAPITLLPGLYLTTGVSMRHDNAAIIGPGASLCTIRQNPAGFGPGGVVEVGNTANDGPSYGSFVARGFTIDGNRAALARPTDDLHGHGMALTSITHFHISDVRAVNCWNAGVGIFINSNHGFVDVYVANCGNGVLTAPGFDINSSKFIVGRVISERCYQGARNLDNTWGNVLDLTIDSPLLAGFTDGNQSVNESCNNQFTVAVQNGGGDGIQVGPNCRNSQYRVTVERCRGNAVQEVYYTASAQRPSGNTYTVSSRNNGSCSCMIGGDGGNWLVSSHMDGRSGKAGSSYAIHVDGQRNNITANVADGSVPQVRGVSFTDKSVGNHLLAFQRNSLVSEYNDDGTANRFTPRVYRGSMHWLGGTISAGEQAPPFTIAVGGALPGAGDIATARLAQDFGGVSITAEVTGEGIVTCWISNGTGVTRTVGPTKVYAEVTKASP
jgi:hypothetical protein